LSNILLVEDEPSILTLMALVLEPLGHNLLRASTVNEAFQRFDEFDSSIDLLIADVNLPVTSGIRVALELRSRLPNLRIILTSGHTPEMWPEPEAAELQELPSDSVGVLLKPFRPATLLKAVSRFVEAASEQSFAAATAAPGIG
jgi:CheY-like chemotaxis protein